MLLYGQQAAGLRSQYIFPAHQQTRNRSQSLQYGHGSSLTAFPLTGF
jgi:hypothetical protein